MREAWQRQWQMDDEIPKVSVYSQCGVGWGGVVGGC